MKTLELLGVTKYFGNRAILKDVSISFPSKGLFFISGDSGSGKTTLLNILSGIDIDYTGDVFSFSKILNEEDEDARSDLRLRNYGFIRQGYDLFELENIFYNVAFPLRGLGVKHSEIKRKVKEVLSYLGLEKKIKQKVNTLSGGEKQRVAIARALASDPKIILADEPTGALDSKNGTDVYEILKDLSKTRLVIVVSHDLTAAFSYADKIVYLRNNNLEMVDNLLPEKKQSNYLSFKPKKKKEIKWSFFLWFKHASNLMKAKRFRSSIMMGIISFSLISLGLSFYVQRDLGNQINSVFSSLSGVNGIVMESNSKTENTFGKIMSADFDSIKKLQDECKGEIEGCGITYLCPYEQYFKDANEMYFDSFGRKTTISSLSVRNINEYLWMEKLDEKKKVYPERPIVMENEQIVLALPYSTMVNMCYSLQIERTYLSLGKYLKRKPLEIYLETANESWGYSDLQLFSLIGVLEEDTPSIYHTRRDWNECILEDSMGFPTSNEDGSSLPWILRKTYYIIPKTNKERFFSFAREKNILDRFVFERDSYYFDQTHNKKNATPNNEKLYVYQADKESLKYSYINEIKEKYDFTNYAVFGESSYLLYPGAMISGFSFPFLVSPSKNAVMNFADLLTNFPKDESFMNVEVPSNIVMGYYLKGGDNSVSLSSDFSSLKSGRKPNLMNEVCLSSSLYEKLNKENDLYVEGVVGQEDAGSKYKYDFRLGELHVTGVIENDKYVIYSLPTFSIDYFRDELGMTSFSLEPKRVLFYCNSNKSKDILPIISTNYPSLSFNDPSLTIEDSISNVIVYAGIVLNFASTITVTTSFILLLCSALLLVLENQKEERILYEIGVKRKNIFDSFACNLFLISFLTLLLSVFTLFFAEITLKKALGETFGANTNLFSFDFVPHLIMILFSFIGLFISCLFLKLYLERRNHFKKEKNKNT